MIFIATFFVVGEARDSTGVTAWAGQQVITRGGDRRSSLLVVIGVLAAVLTALISVNGAVSALLPVVVVAARSGIPPSQMLMPLAFSAHAGSMLALTGTPVNIIVSEAGADAGARRFAFVEFAAVGVPLLVGTLVIILLLGHRLLPERLPSSLPQDLGDLAETLRSRTPSQPTKSW